MNPRILILAVSLVFAVGGALALGPAIVFGASVQGGHSESRVMEVEPNDGFAQAMALSLPGPIEVRGDVSPAGVISGPPWPALVLTNSVATDPNVCATTNEISVSPGTDVYYCYEVTNTGNVTLTLHNLDDSELGPLLDGFPHTLVPNASTYLTVTSNIRATTINTATWTAYNLGPTDVVTVTKLATVTVPGGMASSTTSYLPFILTDFSAAPDLVVENLSAGSGGVIITIRNIGRAPVIDAFWVDVYFNPNPAPPNLNQPWNAIAQAGAVWGVTKPLAPGERLILTSGGDYYDAGSSSSSFPAGAQTYALVDSINFSTSYGNVPESNEANNVFGPIISTSRSWPASGTSAAPSLAGRPER